MKINLEFKVSATTFEDARLLANDHIKAHGYKVIDDFCLRSSKKVLYIGATEGIPIEWECFSQVVKL